MNYEENLFIETLNDLKERISTNAPYKIMKSTGLIRLLFFEGSPLVDRVNLEHKKIQFLLSTRIQESSVSEKAFTPALSVVLDQLDPECPLFPGMTKKNVSRDKFFSKKIILTTDKSYSIKDVILFEAHVMGGIHAGAPKKDRQKALVAINNTFQICDERVSIYLVKVIAKNIIQALNPLEESIIAKYST